jgi:signal transduction histidine kinase
MLFACAYQAYWLNNLYNDQLARMEVGIMTAMRNADFNNVASPGFSEYSDQLQRELIQQGILLESYSEKIELPSGTVIQTIPDSFSGDMTSSAYRPYVFPYDVEGKYAYRLHVKRPDLFVLRQMSGIFITSLLLIALLFLTYYYLWKVILKQKNLNEIKSDFVNNMTHELKTPLSVASAANDALLSYGMGDDPEKREQYLRISREQLRHLSALIEQILTMSVEERKNMKLSPEAIRLSDLFRSLEEQYSLQASKAVQIAWKVSPEDLTIQADRIHFRNIIGNLMENAVKYSGDNVRIELEAKRSTRGMEIAVKDNGIGIPAVAIPRIFDRFYRVPSGNIHNIKGYGLGLAYVKAIVEKHGWSIRVESEEGVGSRFVISEK